MQLLDVFSPEKLRERLSQPFDVGDEVRVLSGHWEGEPGTVRAVRGAVVTVDVWGTLRDYDELKLRLEP